MKTVLILLSIISLSFCTGTKLEDSNYTETVLGSDDVWLVEVFSPLCGTCKEFSPKWAQYAKDFETKFKIGT